MNFRDWLIVGGIVIILGILADGYRRMRLAKSDSLKMSRNMGAGIETSPLDDDFNPELPGGGARIIGPETSSNDSVPEVDVDVDALQHVEDAARMHASLDTEEPGHDDVPISADVSDRVSSKPQAAKTVKNKAEPKNRQNKPSKSVDTQASAAQTSSQNSSSGEQEVIVINVDARQGLMFQGSDIKQLLEACGLIHGEMSIFHRHEEDDLLSPMQFSVANAVEPGYFDPEKMATLETPGVSFFMSMPGPKDYMKAFDFMLETAQCFAKNLGGELSDEGRSVLTKQTIEHFKHRVREFERRQLSKSRA